MMSLKCIMQLLSQVGPLRSRRYSRTPLFTCGEVTRSCYDKRTSLSPGRLLRKFLHSTARPRLHCLYPIVVSVRGKCSSILLATNELADFLRVLVGFSDRFGTLGFYPPGRTGIPGSTPGSSHDGVVAPRRIIDCFRTLPGHKPILAKNYTPCTGVCNTIPPHRSGVLNACWETIKGIIWTKT